MKDIEHRIETSSKSCLKSKNQYIVQDHSVGQREEIRVTIDKETHCRERPLYVHCKSPQNEKFCKMHRRLEIRVSLRSHYCDHPARIVTVE